MRASVRAVTRAGSILTAASNYQAMMIRAANGQIGPALSVLPNLPYKVPSTRATYAVTLITAAGGNSWVGAIDGYGNFYAYTATAASPTPVVRANGGAQTLYAPCGMAASPDGQVLAISQMLRSSSATYLYVHGIDATGWFNFYNPWYTSANLIYGMAWSPASDALAVSDANTSPYLRLYLRAGTRAMPYVSGPYAADTATVGPPRTMAWSPDGKYLLVDSRSSQPYVYERTSATALTLRAKWAALPNAAGYMTSMAFNPSGSLAAIGHDKGLSVYAFAPGGGTLLTGYTTPYPGSAVTGVAFDASGDTLYADVTVGTSGYLVKHPVIGAAVGNGAATGLGSVGLGYNSLATSMPVAA